MGHVTHSTTINWTRYHYITRVNVRRNSHTNVLDFRFQVHTISVSGSIFLLFMVYVFRLSFVISVQLSQMGNAIYHVIDHYNQNRYSLARKYTTEVKIPLKYIRFVYSYAKLVYQLRCRFHRNL